MKRLLALLVIAASGSVQAETAVVGQESLVNLSQAFTEIQPGMPADVAIQLLGREPDQTTEIGAACGMLEILSWRGEQTKLIASDGVISSIILPNDSAITEKE